MIWPFKRKPKLSRDEFVAQFPPAPCGNQITHYEWIKFDNMPCPICASNLSRARVAAEKDAELNALADKIVERLRKVRIDPIIFGPR